MSDTKYEKLRELLKEVEEILPWHNHEGDWVTRDHQDIEGLGERDQPADEYGIAACNAVPGLLDENERLREDIKEVLIRMGSGHPFESALREILERK